MPYNIACILLLTYNNPCLVYLDVEVEVMMGFSSLTQLGHACPLSNIYWRYDLKLDQDDENGSRASKG
jgi:hypothetical protein